jgi:hypothetical protein
LTGPATTTQQLFHPRILSQFLTNFFFLKKKFALWSVRNRSSFINFFYLLFLLFLYFLYFFIIFSPASEASRISRKMHRRTHSKNPSTSDNPTVSLIQAAQALSSIGVPGPVRGSFSGSSGGSLNPGK